MKSITSSPARLALAKRRTLLAIGDYAGFSPAELLRESAELHVTLAESHRFGRAAALGIRQIVLDRLISIDREHERRTRPTAA